MQPAVTIIIPAHNEAGYIEACLESLIVQDETAGDMLVIVAANACTDATVTLSHTKAKAFAKRGSTLQVLDLTNPGKTAALNAAEIGLEAGPRIYLDADVICDPDLIGQTVATLDSETSLYVTGHLTVTRARSLVTRAYSDLWQALPFFRTGTVGAGFFAVNSAGRARWDRFPDIISDDTFVRLSFAPSERVEVPARYHWPMIEGFAGLVKVRRRQDAGVAEIRTLYPQLIRNDNTPRLSLKGVLKLAVRAPVNFAVYLAVHLTVRIKRQKAEWTRGR